MPTIKKSGVLGSQKGPISTMSAAALAAFFMSAATAPAFAGMTGNGDVTLDQNTFVNRGEIQGQQKTSGGVATQGFGQLVVAPTVAIRSRFEANSVTFVNERGAVIDAHQHTSGGAAVQAVGQAVVGGNAAHLDVTLNRDSFVNRGEIRADQETSAGFSNQYVGQYAIAPTLSYRTTFRSNNNTVVNERGATIEAKQRTSGGAAFQAAGQVVLM